MSYYYPAFQSSYYIVTKSSPFYHLLPYLMKTIYLIEPKYMFFKEFSTFVSLVKETKGFESIRASVVNDEDLDYSQLAIPKSILNRFTQEEQKEFQKLAEEFSKEKKQKRLFYDLIKQAFDIDIAGGGLLWITTHPLGLQVKYVYIYEFLELDKNRQLGFLLETLDEIDGEFPLIKVAAEAQQEWESGKLTPREIADAIDNVEDIDLKNFKYLSDKLLSLGLRVKLNPGKIKLIIKDKYERHKIFIAGIDEEVKMTPLQKSFYFLILLFEEGINITSDLNSRDYKTYNEVWVDLYTKLKSCDKNKARQRIDNLCENQQKLSSEKTRTNKPFKEILKRAHPINYKTFLEEFIVKYNQWNVKLLIEVPREQVDSMTVIEKLLSGKLIVR